MIVIFVIDWKLLKISGCCLVTLNKQRLSNVTTCGLVITICMDCSTLLLLEYCFHWDSSLQDTIGVNHLKCGSLSISSFK